jgi:hypothetical protein
MTFLKWTFFEFFSPFISWKKNIDKDKDKDKLSFWNKSLINTLFFGLTVNLCQPYIVHVFVLDWNISRVNGLTTTHSFMCWSNMWSLPNPVEVELGSANFFLHSDQSLAKQSLDNAGADLNCVELSLFKTYLFLLIWLLLQA